METFSALLAIFAGNSPVPGEFPSQRPVTRSFDIYFDLRVNKRLCKQSWGWWFETLLCPLWRHSNVNTGTFINSSPTYASINGLVQDCGISSALAMEILQSFAKASIYASVKQTIDGSDNVLSPDRLLANI